MKTAQIVWLLIGIYVIIQNGLALINGQDLIGIIILSFTSAKIVNPKFSVTKFIKTAFTV